MSDLSIAITYDTDGRPACAYIGDNFAAAEAAAATVIKGKGFARGLVVRNPAVVRRFFPAPPLPVTAPPEPPAATAKKKS